MKKVQIVQGDTHYNVPIKPDKIFDNLSEPDIINDR